MIFWPTTLDSTYHTSERFGEGTGPVLIDYINCTGSELDIWWDCSHFTHFYGCSHIEDVGVQCHPGRWYRKKNCWHCHYLKDINDAYFASLYIFFTPAIHVNAKWIYKHSLLPI